MRGRGRRRRRRRRRLLSLLRRLLRRRLGSGRLFRPSVSGTRRDRLRNLLACNEHEGGGHLRRRRCPIALLVEPTANLIPIGVAIVVREVTQIIRIDLLQNLTTGLCVAVDRSPLPTAIRQAALVIDETKFLQGRDNVLPRACRVAHRKRCRDGFWCDPPTGRGRHPGTHLGPRALADTRVTLKCHDLVLRVDDRSRWRRPVDGSRRYRGAAWAWWTPLLACSDSDRIPPRRTADRDDTALSDPGGHVEGTAAPESGPIDGAQSPEQRKRSRAGEI